MSDAFLFAEDTDEDVKPEHLGCWKVLIVDDEPEVHAVTKLALSDFVFQDRTLDFVSAYSGKEAIEAFKQHDDIAIALLDVVMETDDAGLKVAKYVRDEMNNHFTRIILRTGQPGQAPERDVILNYDINDYKSKTELTAQKLFTVVIATLRSYRDIVSIEESRQGLEKIISASADLFSLRSFESFVEGIVQQLSSLLGGTKDAAYITSAVMGPQPIDQVEPREFFVFTGKGEYENVEGSLLDDVVKGDELEACYKALSDKSLVYNDEYVVAYCEGKTTHGSILYLSGLNRKLTALDKNLIDIFSQNVQIAFDNVLLTKEIEDTQREIVERLGQAMEYQHFEGGHIRRMIAMSEFLARRYGLDEEQVELLKVAVPLHDVGKLRIPSSLLVKPGALSDQEKDLIKEHAQFGYNLLKDSTRPAIAVAAEVARDHHEHWNGKGYPKGVMGKDIHVFSRITAVSDVYDSLRHKRSYKEVWSLQQTTEYFAQRRGEQFDPALVDILLENIDHIEAIQSQYPDSQEN